MPVYKDEVKATGSNKFALGKLRRRTSRDAVPKFEGDRLQPTEHRQHVEKADNRRGVPRGINQNWVRPIPLQHCVYSHSASPDCTYSDRTSPGGTGFCCAYSGSTSPNSTSPGCCCSDCPSPDSAGSYCAYSDCMSSVMIRFVPVPASAPTAGAPRGYHVSADGGLAPNICLHRSQARPSRHR